MADAAGALALQESGLPVEALQQRLRAPPEEQPQQQQQQQQQHQQQQQASEQHGRNQHEGDREPHHSRRSLPPLAPVLTTDLLAHESKHHDPVSPLLPGQLDVSHGTGDLDDLNSNNPVSPLALSRKGSATSEWLSPTTSTVAMLQSVEPAPAYVAIFGADQIANDDQTRQLIQGDKEDVRFTDPAVTLVNAFLDHILHSILHSAQSTSLTALRRAIVEVLKLRLGKAAIANADDELRELLSGNEDEEEANTQRNSGDHGSAWDLELVWKRTRLRVMVYMRLGEMEDEDEQRYVNNEDLFQGSERRFSQATGLVSWAAAIFLTSILEFVAEQMLRIATQAAVARGRRASTDEAADNAVQVKERDVEKLALSSILGRTWRTWRRTLLRTTHDVDLSLNETDPGATTTTDPMDPEDLDDLAARVPLPMHDLRRDIDEIEVPGLAQDPDRSSAAGTLGKLPMTPTRRKSLDHVETYRTVAGLLTPEGSRSSASLIPRPPLARQRSTSVPTPNRTPLPFEQRYAPPGAFPVDDDDHHLDALRSPFDKVGKSTRSGAVNWDGEVSPKATSTRDQSTWEKTAQDIEELDSRKTHIDVKSMGRFSSEQHSRPDVTEVAPRSHDSAATAQTPSSPTLEADRPSPSQLLDHSRAPTSDQAFSTLATPAPKRPSGVSGIVLTSNASAPDAGPPSTSEPSPVNNHGSATVGDGYDHRRSLSHGRASALPEVVPLSEMPMTRGPQDTVILTSASIRGLEDFDSFGNVDEMAPELMGDLYTMQTEPVELPAVTARVTTSAASHRHPSRPSSRDVESRAGRTTASKPATSAARSDAGSIRTGRSRRSHSVSRPPSRNLSAHQRSGLMAREPRVQTESTRDFADFIRSTGPNKRQDMTPVIITTRRSSASLRDGQNAIVNFSRSMSLDRGKHGRVSTETSGLVPPVPEVPVIKTRVRTTMEPRSPTAASTRASEFIEFIRSGPMTEGQHRISRTVAPFRSTMDSDQLQDYGDSINNMQRQEVEEVEEVETAPAGLMGVGRHTKRRSVSLPNVYEFSSYGNSVQPAHSGEPQRLTGFESGSTAPARKQVRNKDPYARYYMDEYDDDEEVDDDVLTALPKSPEMGESLAEFLANSTPPRENNANPPVNSRISVTSGLGAKGSPGAARSARSLAATRAETNDLIQFLNAGPPTDSAPSPTIGPMRHSIVQQPKESKKARPEGNKRNSIRRSGLFSWIK